LQGVKCRDCGLLSIRSCVDSLIYPADEAVRESGATRRYNSSDTAFVFDADRIICFQGFPALESDLSAMRAYEAIHNERDCPHFVANVPGLTPQRHHDMSLIEQVQSLNSQQRAEDLRWQKQVEALYETRHQELRRDTARFHRQSFVVSLAGVLVSILAAVLSAMVTVWFTTPTN